MPSAFFLPKFGGIRMNRFLKSKIIEKYGTQSDFAAAIQRCDSAVSRVVRGRVTLKTDDRALWAKALGASVDELFREE